jgi:SAM-dependent methyltransferase
MAATCPIGFDTERLRAQVLATYDRVAREPEGDFHFHRGPEYAAEYLNYDRRELAQIPARATARFAGVGNPHRIGLILPGETMLDHACGGGMDLLLAARRVGPRGRAIGVDMTPAMRESAAIAAREAGLDGVVEVRPGMYEELPVADSSVDVVISNGVVNLAPDKTRVFREISGAQARRTPVPGDVWRASSRWRRANPDLWAACIGGALPEPELFEIAAAAGLRDGRITERFDCFRNTSAEVKVSKDLRVHAVNFFACK